MQHSINYNLITILVFTIFLIIIFWIMPEKKSRIVVLRLSALVRVLSIQKILLGLIEQFKK